MQLSGLRRYGRIRKEIPILLMGREFEGKAFSEETTSVVLSRHGAGIVSRNRLVADQELVLRRLDTDQETGVRLVGYIGTRDDLHTYGVAFLDSEINFWKLDFPPTTQAERAASRLLMACVICNHEEIVSQNELEVDIYTVNHRILRHCQRCKTTTMWVRSADANEGYARVSRFGKDFEPVLAAPEAADPVDDPRPSTVSPAKSDTARNRRSHVRTKANFSACVRGPNFSEDVVVCENMSRGGLCFKSSQRYYEDSEIQVAAPYTRGMPPIFVNARITWVEELRSEKLYRYGVAYAADGQM
jgi:hypothetical protein